MIRRASPLSHHWYHITEMPSSALADCRLRAVLGAGVACQQNGTRNASKRHAVAALPDAATVFGCFHTTLMGLQQVQDLFHVAFHWQKEELSKAGILSMSLATRCWATTAQVRVNMLFQHFTKTIHIPSSQIQQPEVKSNRESITHLFVDVGTRRASSCCRATTQTGGEPWRYAGRGDAIGQVVELRVYHGVSWCIMVYHGVSWCIMVYYGVSWCIWIQLTQHTNWDNVITLRLSGACFAARLTGAAVGWLLRQAICRLFVCWLYNVHLPKEYDRRLKPQTQLTLDSMNATGDNIPA